MCGRIIFKWILKEQGTGVSTNLIWSGLRSHGCEASGSIKAGSFLSSSLNSSFSRTQARQGTSREPGDPENSVTLKSFQAAFPDHSRR
jgi:hypothetical protein